MPISAEKQKLYPGGSLRSKEWQAIRDQIRERSGDKCEGCGLENSAHILRSKDGSCYFIDEEPLSCVGWVRNADTGEDIKKIWLMDTDADDWAETYISIVLTVAHLHENDEATTDIDRLRHWCQRCHNKFDAKMRAETARKTREKKSGQINLFTPTT